MSTELTPFAPLLNLAIYFAAILAMVGAALWADRAIKRAEPSPARDTEPLAWRLTAAQGVVAPPALGPVANALRERVFPGRLALPDLACLLARHERRALCIVFGLALVLRLAFLETLPGTVSADELDFGSNALEILQGGGPALFGLDWTQQPALSVHLIALSWRLFGVTIFAERLVSALLTACAIFPFYALVRRAVGVTPALAATILFAASRWFLLFSRSAWTNGHLVLFLLIAAWGITRALEGRRLRDWAIGGVGLALLLYSYFSGRAVVLALLVYLAVALGRSLKGAITGGWRAPLVGAVVAGAVCAILFLPQIPIMLKDWEHANNRVRAVYLFTEPLAPGETVPGVLARQVWTTVHSFILMDTATGTGPYKGPDQSWLDPISALLFVGGMGLALRRRRGTGLWWCLFLIPLGMTQLLSAGIPNGARALVIVAPMYFFVALALDALLRLPALQRPPVQVALAGWVAILVAANVGSYAAWMGSPEATVARGPAVEVRDFYLWREYQLARLEAGEGIMNAGEYNALPPADIAARVAARVVADRGDSRDGDAPTMSAPPRDDLAREVATVGTPGQETGRLGLPRAVAADGRGNLYVVDTARGKILKFAADGAFILECAMPEGAAQPWAVVAMPDGTIVVLDAAAGGLARFSAEGAFLGMVPPLGDPSASRGLALGLDGRIYVAQTASNRIVAVPVAGLAGAQGSPAPNEAAKHAQPTAAIADKDGALFVYEPDNDRLRGYAPDGQPRFTRKVPGADTLTAGGLAILPDGRVALADAEGRRVLVYDAGGVLIGSFPVAGKPQGLAVTPAGLLAVADAEGQRIRLYQFDTP